LRAAILLQVECRVEVKIRLKTRLQKTRKDSPDVTRRGSSSQTLGTAASAKARSPTVDNRVRRTTGDDDDDAERRRSSYSFDVR